MKAISVFTAFVLIAASSALASDVPEVMRDCGTCHLKVEGAGAPLREPLSGLCIGCHPDRVQADHPVDVKPSMAVAGLPFDEAGRMTCATCHDPHGESGIERMLRTKPKLLCVQCHIK